MQKETCGSTALCSECSKINMLPASNDPSRTLIRRYQNAWSLAGYANICDVCALIYADPTRLQIKDVEEWRAYWGEELFEQVLNQVNIDVYYINDVRQPRMEYEFRIDDFVLGASLNDDVPDKLCHRNSGTTGPVGGSSSSSSYPDWLSGSFESLSSPARPSYDFGAEQPFETMLTRSVSCFN